MGREYVSREKKLPMVNFLIFVQKNVSTIRFQEIKIRPFGDFEKMRFLCFYIIKSMAICGTHVQAILDQKNLTGLAGGVREGQNMAQNGPHLCTFLALEPSRHTR